MNFMLIFLVATATAIKHTCKHTSQGIRMTTFHQPIDGNPQAAVNPENIRITVMEYEGIDELENVEIYKKRYIDSAINYWERAIKVRRPLSGPLLVERSCENDEFEHKVFNNKKVKVCKTNCTEDLLISDDMLARCYYRNKTGINSEGIDGEGIPDTDLVLLWRNEKNCEKGLLAYASGTIARDAVTDRPIIGMMTTCSENMKNVSESSGIYVIKHELMHVLALSVGHYAYYRDELGNPRTPRNANGEPNLGVFHTENFSFYKPSNETVKFFNATERTSGGLITKEMATLVTPKVKREAEKHFNCTDLEGMPLEDFGEKANSFSHFEARIAYSDLMSAELNSVGAASRILFALLEDSGWYIMDYKLTDDVQYGKNLGCDFVKKGCFEYLELKKAKNESTFPFCNDQSVRTCTGNRKVIRSCDYIKDNQNINGVPMKFRYFSDNSLVSGTPFTDYCPMFLDLAENCNKGSFKDSPFGYGSSSKCFDSPLDSSWTRTQCNKVQKYRQFGAGCFKFRCSKIHKLLVTVKNKDFQCQHDGQVLNVTVVEGKYLFHGFIKCPSCHEICKKSICSKTPRPLIEQSKSGIYQDFLAACNGSSKIGMNASLIFLILKYIFY